MDELHHRGQLQKRCAARLFLVTDRTGGKEQQRREQALAAGGDDVLRHLADQGDIGVQACPDQLIDARHVARDGGQHGHEIHDSLIIPSLCRRKAGSKSCTQSSSPAASSTGSSRASNCAWKRLLPTSAPPCRSRKSCSSATATASKSARPSCRAPRSRRPWSRTGGATRCAFSSCAGASITRNRRAIGSRTPSSAST